MVTKRSSYRFNDEILARLRVLADRRGISETELIRYLIGNEWERHERSQKKRSEKFARVS